MLRATRGLNGAALAATCLLCLVFGAGDVTDTTLLRALSALLWTVIALGLAVALLTRTMLPRPLRLPLALWLAILAAAALLAPMRRDEAIGALTRPLSGALLAWAVVAVARTHRQWQALCVALALGGAGVAILGLADLVGLVPLGALHYTSVPVADVPRLGSLLSHPNVAASVLELTLPLLVALTFTVLAPWRAIAGALLLAQLAALMLTFSRAGILAAAASLLLFAAIAARHRPRRMAYALGLAGVTRPFALALVGGLVPQVERRLVAEVEQNGYRAIYAAPALVAAAPEQVLDVHIRVTNASTSEWSALDDSRVALGYHLLRTDGTPIAFDCPATLVPADVPPHASLDMVARLHAPAAAGLYLVEWDALREGVAWFSWRGSPTAPMSLVVEPAPLLAAQPPVDSEVILPRPARVQYWNAASSMLRDYPLLGVGPDNFRLRFADYSGISEAHIGTHAHSLYLESLADTGVLGFAGLSVFLLSLVRFGAPAVATRDWLWRAALLAGLTGWLVHGLLDDFERFWPAHVAYWLLIGLLVRGHGLGQRPHCAE